MVRDYLEELEDGGRYIRCMSRPLVRDFEVPAAELILEGYRARAARLKRLARWGARRSPPVTTETVRRVLFCVWVAAAAYWATF